MLSQCFAVAVVSVIVQYIISKAKGLNPEHGVTRFVGRVRLIEIR